ncbi:MAG: DNA modification methylase [Canibacter sp.]
MSARPSRFGGLILKIRLVSSLALVGAVALGAAGCSLMAPISTEKPYAPSDGINADVANVDIRNMLLIAGAEGEPYNVVFSTVNNSGSDVPLSISFDGASTETVSVDVPAGSTLFGDPEGDADLVAVDLGQQAIGSTVTAYLETTSGKSVKTKVPVLDGTLDEYKNFVLTEADVEDAQLELPAQAEASQPESTEEESAQ